MSTHTTPGRRGFALAGLALLAWPVVFVVADLIRMDSDEGETTLATLTSISQHPGTFQLAGWLMYVVAVLTVPVTILLWRLAVDRSPKMAWAGAVLGVLSLIGQVVHLVGYYAVSLGAAKSGDLELSAALLDDIASTPLAAALFVPYLLGIVLGPLVQAVALKRAKVIATWGMVAVIVGQLMFGVAGSSVITTPLWGALFLVGFAPAALAAIRGSGTQPAVAPSPGVAIPVS